MQAYVILSSLNPLISKDCTAIFTVLNLLLELDISTRWRPKFNKRNIKKLEAKGGGELEFKKNNNYISKPYFAALLFEPKKEEIAFIPVLSTFARAFWAADILLVFLLLRSIVLNLV